MAPIEKKEDDEADDEEEEKDKKKKKKSFRKPRPMILSKKKYHAPRFDDFKTLDRTDTSLNTVDTFDTR